MNTQVLMRSSGSGPMGKVLLLAAAGLLLAGGFVLYQLMTAGHSAYNGDSRGIFWGLPIVTYDFFLLSSTGLTMLASAWTVFRLPAFEPIARRALWLAIAALVGGVAALFMELGAPMRAMLLIPFSFTTSAPLFWKVWGIIFYTIALALLVLNWLQPGRGTEPSKTVSIVALAAAVYITFVAGGVYGWMAMRPFWFGGEMSLAFMVEALLGAVTFIIIFTHLANGFDTDRLDTKTRDLFAGPLAGLFAVLIIAHAFFVVSRLIAGLWSNADGMEVWQYLWSRPIFQVELWIGLGLPIVITVLPNLRRSLSLQLLAAIVALVALFVARYDFVVGGQMVALFKGSWSHGLLSYTPSLTEWAVLATAVFLSNAVNAFGEKQFGLGGGS
ncbi:MAG: NrfD/PsrC family molybdoenzyme membrane anchor subunit [Polaromonas sp.]|uniref:NrfD/PsrC family molybdoenzyme membrane anchor subunit n=1 Tax=Polaromonas sp. TaxID=1869339 RepID=UPI002730DE6D|nr:NrfD/PsrC family molybdoenzyme membrane anchor subunit [Polaromonas sp.]MDP2451432.1 NrfD/PsrC family molybdoenzyme membrane anchor subunit [Polaromonas sp.]MDP3826570.1 NrfD/PsrC family molybdoenzyme membrane anchor subunit [Polaromonas sp.]